MKADNAVKVSEAVKEEVATIREQMVTKEALPHIMKELINADVINTGAMDLTPVIFGGLEGATSVEEAETWLNKILSDSQLPKLINPYIKSDALENLLFAQFPTSGTASASIELFRRRAPAFKEKVVWCNIDRPFQARIPLKFLFQFKKLLASWGFPKRGIQVDETSGRMKVGGTEVVEASSKENVFEVTWLDDGWKHWEDLQQAREFKDLVAKFQEELEAAHNRQRKGQGKGKA